MPVTFATAARDESYSTLTAEAASRSRDRRGRGAHVRGSSGARHRRVQDATQRPLVTRCDALARARAISAGSPDAPSPVGIREHVAHGRDETRPRNIESPARGHRVDRRQASARIGFPPASTVSVQVARDGRPGSATPARRPPSAAARRIPQSSSLALKRNRAAIDVRTAVQLARATRLAHVPMSRRPRFEHPIVELRVGATCTRCEMCAVRRDDHECCSRCASPSMRTRISRGRYVAMETTSRPCPPAWDRPPRAREHALGNVSVEPTPAA